MLNIFYWEKLLPKPIIGIDEAGRGCLAGPVFAAAVILCKTKSIIKFKDSKLLSSKQRNHFAEIIFSEHLVGIGIAEVEEIEQMNIFHASYLAMKRALINLSISSGHIIVDGQHVIPGLENFAQTPIVKGDIIAQPISAASIIAKVSRDNYMKKLALDFPQYGFEKHKGYGTKDHLKMINKFGPALCHRKNFSGVKNI